MPTPIVRSILAGSLAAAFAFPGCGGKSSERGAPGATGPVSREQLVDQLVVAFCDGLAACCQSQGFPADVVACRSSYRALLGEAELPDPNLTSYDAVAAGECLDQIRASGAACEDFMGEEIEVCDRVYTGTLPPGADCTSDEECAPVAEGDAVCDFGTGTCMVERDGSAGDVCQRTCTRDGNSLSCVSGGIASTDPPPEPSTTTTICWTNDGLYCSTSGICEALNAIGGACEDYGSCVAGAYCDYTTNTCQPLPGLGESCSTDCTSGNYCSPDGVCEAQKPEGAPCESFDECLGYCDPETGLCVGDSTDTSVQVTAEICAGQFTEG